MSQLAGSDHKPIKISLDINYKPNNAKTFPRWNFQKANWELFSTLTDSYVNKIRNKQQNPNQKVKALNKAILKAAAESIPRGCRKNYKPYWTEEYQEQEDNVTEARERVEEDPTVENNIALKAATAKLRQIYTQEARQSWKEKTEELNLDKEGNKLWKLARLLNDETSRSTPITLEHDGKLLGEKGAANRFMDKYAEVSKIQVPEGRKDEIKENQKAFTNDQGRPLMNTPFTTKELDCAMISLKLKKSPGPDKIHNEMLLHLGPKSRKKLLQLFNDSWREGVVPQSWREAIMIPIHKKGKDKSKPESYRPISLTSCTGKLLERLINTRLMWHLEDQQLISPKQAAFRQDRSTEDQVTYLAQAIEDAFQNKQHTIAIWIDLEKAFDRVWKQGLQLKMKQCGVAGRMYKWICQYLHNRKGRVKIGNQHSRKRLLEQGVPQGGVLSPTLFLIFIKDIIDDMPRKVHGAIYADDLVLWCSEDNVSTANYRLKEALKILERWTTSWLVSINERKTTYTIFSLSNKDLSANLQVNGHTLQANDSPTYLGVTFDRRLTWKHYLQKTQARAKQRLGLMKKLSGTQ